MAGRGGPEETISCPYNKAHQIIRSRMQTHLVKCAKENAHIKLLECPYNSTHRLTSPEYCHHVENCPERYKVDTFMYMPDSVDLNKYPIPNQVVETEESWDDSSVPCYDPQSYCENNAVLRQKQVAGEAARRAFRFEQRQRYQSVKSIQSVPQQDREKAYHLAKRYSNVTSSAPDIDEDEDQFNTIPLLERIKLGDTDPSSKDDESSKYEDAQESVLQREDEFPPLNTKGHKSTEASKNEAVLKDANDGKPLKGKGRGRFLKR